MGLRNKILEEVTDTQTATWRASDAIATWRSEVRVVCQELDRPYVVNNNQDCLDMFSVSQYLRKLLKKLHPSSVAKHIVWFNSTI